MIMPPTSQISHHHKVTNITMSPTSLSPTPSDTILKNETILKGTDDEPIWEYDSEILNMKVGSI